jgi:hypothetical protein
MSSINYIPGLAVNQSDLGLEVRGDVVCVPAALRPVLEKMGVKSALALASVLQSFPTAITVELGWNDRSAAAACAGALSKLRDLIGAARFNAATNQPRRGYGAMPPNWIQRKH